MSRAIIVIEVDSETDYGTFTAKEAVAEVLFNAGIGKPEHGEEWPNMSGQAYRVISFSTLDVTNFETIPEYSMSEY